jgi:hypothetical protein
MPRNTAILGPTEAYCDSCRPQPDAILNCPPSMPRLRHSTPDRWAFIIPGVTEETT